MELADRRNALMLRVQAVGQRYTAPLTEASALRAALMLGEVSREMAELSAQADGLAAEYQALIKP